MSGVVNPLLQAREKHPDADPAKSKRQLGQSSGVSEMVVYGL